MRPLRITLLAPFGIRPKGTLLVRMLPLAQSLARRGHQVRIVAPPVHNPQDAGRCAVYDGVPVLHTNPRPAHGVPGGGAHVAALLRELLAVPCDVCHLFKPKGYSGLAALLARLLRPTLPLVVDTDDWEGWGGWNDLLPYPYAAKVVFAWQEQDLPRRAAAVTVASRTLETLVWGAGVAPQRVAYLPNGIHPPGSAPPARRATADAPVVLLYTRFWEFAVRDVVEMLLALRQMQPRARLRIVGRGERGEEHTLRQLADRVGVGAMLDDRGWVEPAMIPALLATADVAIVPLDDTLINRARCSVKLLELMAAGLPIVAADVGQVAAYLQDGVSGVLVPPAAPVAMARVVAALLEDAPRRQQLGQAAYAATAAFAWDRLAPIAEQVYYATLSARQVQQHVF